MTRTLEDYQTLVTFLGTILSHDYEIVLHWIDDHGEFYIAAIAHSEISGRNLNSPVTGYALELINDRVYERQDFVSNYKAQTNAKTIQGSTFFIKDDNGALLGLLCVNFDSSTYIDLAEQMAVLARVPLMVDPHRPLTTDTREVLHASVEEIIDDVIDPSLRHSEVNLSQAKKVAICNDLAARGLFKIKGAIPKVAMALNVSVPSVYRYLKMIS